MCNVKMISAQCGFCLRLYTLSIWDKMFSSHLCRHVQPICCGVSDILCVQPTLQYHSVQNPIALWLVQLRYVPLHYLGTPGTSRGVTSLKFGCLHCKCLQGLCREIGVQGFQIYGDCMYTRNPCNLEISTLLFSL